MDDTQDTTSAPFAQGQVSLPNDGQILSTSTPDAQESQQPDAQAQPQPSGPSGFQGNVPQINAPLGNAPSPNSALNPAAIPQGPQTTAPSAPAKPTVPPAVQKASMFHDVAQALAGGPRYKYTVDAEGNMQKVPLPISNAHIGMAIALEALSGAFTGLGQHGPNAAGQAAQQGFQQGFQTNEQQIEKPKAEAQQDFARRAQVTETNMRMYSMARQIGKMDEEQTDNYIGQYKDLANRLQTEFPSYVKGIAKYSDLAKYNVTQDNAIPYMKTPRRDVNGNQVTDSRGIPQWDIDYLILDPSLKASGLMDKDTLSTLSEMGKPWANNDLLSSSPMGLMMALNLKSQAAQWKVGKQTIGNFFDTINKANGKADTTGTENPGILQQPDLKNEAISGIADTMATKYSDEIKNVIPPDSFNALVKAVIQQESGGNPNVQNNPTSGAMGLMQLLPSTAKMLNVADPHNPTQNVEAGSKYLASLINQYKDIPTALAAYGGGLVDGKITPNGQKYVDQVSARVGGLNNAQPSEQPSAESAHPLTGIPDLAEEVKTHPTLPADMERFNSALAASNGSYATAIAHLNGKPETQQTAANITALLGGADNIRKVDNYNKIQQDSAEEQQKNDNKLDYESNKKKQEESGIISRNENLINALATGKNIDLSRIATMRAYDREIITNEILKRNPNYNPASIDRAIKLADEASDESKTGSIGNSVRNVNTAFGHMGEATEHLNTLNQLEGRTFSDYLNKPMSWMDTHFGGNDKSSQEFQRWKVSLNAAATDWQNLLNNQHALTDHDKEVAKTVADPNATFGNAMAALQEMARTGAIRTIPLDQRWMETMHTHYPNLIEPQTIDALRKINDPIVNQYLGEFESGGSLVNGEKGVGEKGQKVSDLLKNPVKYPGQLPGEVPGIKTINGSQMIVGYQDAQGHRRMLTNPIPVPKGQQ